MLCCPAALAFCTACTFSVTRLFECYRHYREAQLRHLHSTPAAVLSVTWSTTPISGATSLIVRLVGILAPVDRRMSDELFTGLGYATGTSGELSRFRWTWRGVSVTMGSVTERSHSQPCVQSQWPLHCWPATVARASVMVRLSMSLRRDFSINRRRSPKQRH